VTFAVDAFLAWAAGDLSEIHIEETKRTPKRLRGSAWSDAAKGESINNSSRRLDSETRQEWTQRTTQTGAECSPTVVHRVLQRES
jgi:hypothetical protein